MNNTRVRLLIGSGVAVTGAVLLYAARTRSKNRSLLVRTRKQADILKRQAAKLGEAAVDGLADVLAAGKDAGKAVYHRVADQVADRVAG
jgi:hypothetical protein